MRSADFKRRLRKFGLTAEQYFQIKSDQNSKCALCDFLPSEDDYALAVDHCHRTGRVRGLLCHRCNTALERVDDIPDWIERVLAYKKKFE